MKGTIQECSIVAFERTGSAVADNMDYAEVMSMNLTFPAHSNDGDIQCLNISILDDALVEGSETFTVILSVPTTTGLVVTTENSMTTITIIDDES